MAVLGKDLFPIRPDFFEFVVFFGNTQLEVEDKTYQYGELTTAFLNYDSTAYKKAMAEYDSDHSHKNALDSIILEMPLFRDLYLPERIGNADEEQYRALLEDLELLPRYRWFLDEMNHGQIKSKSNRYANQIEQNGMSAFVSGRSLGLSPQCDPVLTGTQFEIRTDEQGGARLFEKMTFTRLSDFIYMDFFKGMMADFIPKKCKLCGRYFLQEKSFSYEYCDLPASDSQTETCRETGALKSFRSKARNNDIWKLHQRAYKKYYARVLKGKMSKPDFNAWALEAETLRDEMLPIYAEAVSRGEVFDTADYEAKLNCL